MTSVRDLALAVAAKSYGARYSLRIILEVRRAQKTYKHELPISAGFALIDQETGFANVFGHDDTMSIKPSWRGTEVTREKYLLYKHRRQLGMGAQGVGPAQLTYHVFQDRADELGGCWIPKHNIRVGIDLFASNYSMFRSQKYGTREALRRAAVKYNGSLAYGPKYLDKYDKWHRRFAKLGS